MASTSAISMALPLPRASSSSSGAAARDAFFKPLPLRALPLSPPPRAAAGKFQVRAAAPSSLKDKAVTGLTAAALTASMIIPDAAEAAVSPSLKNFLLSIVAGGVVFALITGVVVAVANFDPVKRT
ncbi:uncharacterized protein LOC127264160 [Andrographis paniculata]|uniref:uncharacterized protein LOC127264160 n=1 Tax=Andrographis paniculata TaxID=175694 RepID=UPI0021E932D3|nr:uncharacterized protein LOC127264160 [Andrographis paniculata]